MIVYKCARCGGTLDVYDMKGYFGVPTIYLAKCPYCGHRFKYKIARVEVKPKQRG